MIELRDYQRNAINAVYRYYRDENNTGNVIISASTGAGKSIIIAKLIQEIIQGKPNRRVLMLSHVRELLAQNASKLISAWQSAPLGFYSAGLKKKQLGHPITIASIQSCYKKGHYIGFIHVVIIDEVHLLSEKDDGMYRQLLKCLKEINPKLKIIGLSATPWRTKGGLLTEGENPLFDEIVYEIGISELVDRGYLCKIISKKSKNQADLSSVPTRMGEFSSQEMEDIMDNEELTNAALDEVIKYGEDRKSWLFFCCGIKHAYHVCEALQQRGITAACVTGDTPTMERDRIFADFKNGRIKALTNNTVLTTGTDIPRIDLLILLRGTKSPGLFLQMVGRAMRLSPETGKNDALLLDYAGNLERFGCIDQIKAPTIKKKKDKGEVPMKFCSVCDTGWPISTLECKECGFIFPVNTIYKHDVKATNAPVMSKDAEWWNIDGIVYKEHPGKIIKKELPDGTIKQKVNPTTLQVTYSSGNDETGIRLFREWVCINHTGYARQKAKKWVQERLVTDPDASLIENLQAVDDFTIQDATTYSDSLIAPIRIKVRRNGKYEEIIDYEF